MLVTVSWISRNYDKYNKMYFDDKLPKIEFKVSRSRKTWGYASYTYNLTRNTIKPTAITLSNYYDSPEEVKLTTLLHEMIHIYDYTINPNHFVFNHRKVRYDAHGYWFKNECRRLAKFGWDIEKHVTAEEKACSTLTAVSVAKEKAKQDNALVVIVRGDNGYNWMYKTNDSHIALSLNTASRVNWHSTCGNVKDINVYRFNDHSLALQRSAGKSIRGWRLNYSSMLKRLEKIKATEIHDYDKMTRNVVARLAA